MSGVAQPTRRTLVKGAAWSVPVVAMASAAPAHAASPCTVAVQVTCANNSLEFTYTVTGPVPDSLEFTLNITGSGQGGDGNWTPGTGVQEVAPRVFEIASPSTGGPVVTVARPAAVGSRTYALTVSNGGECDVTSATGTITAGTCDDGTNASVSRSLQLEVKDTVEPAPAPTTEPAPAPTTEPAPAPTTESTPAPATADDASATSAP